ncbi:hypothetical protein F5Y16DRAFT_377055 [Xylariaceae sp. FL0255]|nr:hypothetical protein F5Y16DRAFT_377055 [Xylariaceae sp. FL0255]
MAETRADPKKGGDLNRMAKDGTKVPNDAGESYKELPSVPNPSQKQPKENGFGATTLNTAADNPVGAPVYDDDAITASGHSVPSAMFEKPSGHGGKEANH